MKWMGPFSKVSSSKCLKLSVVNRHRCPVKLLPYIPRLVMEMSMHSNMHSNMDKHMDRVFLNINHMIITRIMPNKMDNHSILIHILSPIMDRPQLIPRYMPLILKLLHQLPHSMDNMQINHHTIPKLRKHKVLHMEIRMLKSQLAKLVLFMILTSILILHTVINILHNNLPFSRYNLLPHSNSHLLSSNLNYNNCINSNN